MLITRQFVANRIAAYLRREMTLSQLVDWAENALMESEFEGDSTSEVAAVVARLGVADVRAFGLTWDDCESLLRTLGYDARVEVIPA